MPSRISFTDCGLPKLCDSRTRVTESKTLSISFNRKLDVCRLSSNGGSSKVMENNLTFCEGNALKYITRHRRKGDGARDIHKAIHYLEMILEIEYGEK